MSGFGGLVNMFAAGANRQRVMQNYNTGMQIAGRGTELGELARRREEFAKQREMQQQQMEMEQQQMQMQNAFTAGRMRTEQDRFEFDQQKWARDEAQQDQSFAFEQEKFKDSRARYADARERAQADQAMQVEKHKEWQAQAPIIAEQRKLEVEMQRKNLAKAAKREAVDAEIMKIMREKPDIPAVTLAQARYLASGDKEDMENYIKVRDQEKKEADERQSREIATRLTEKRIEAQIQLEREKFEYEKQRYQVTTENKDIEDDNAVRGHAYDQALRIALRDAEEKMDEEVDLNRVQALADQIYKTLRAQRRARAVFAPPPAPPGKGGSGGSGAPSGGAGNPFTVKEKTRREWDPKTSQWVEVTEYEPTKSKEKEEWDPGYKVKQGPYKYRVDEISQPYETRMAELDARMKSRDKAFDEIRKLGEAGASEVSFSPGTQTFEEFVPPSLNVKTPYDKYISHEDELIRDMAEKRRTAVLEKDPKVKRQVHELVSKTVNAWAGTRDQKGFAELKALGMTDEEARNILNYEPGIETSVGPEIIAEIITGRALLRAAASGAVKGAQVAGHVVDKAAAGALSAATRASNTVNKAAEVAMRGTAQLGKIPKIGPAVEAAANLPIQIGQGAAGLASTLASTPLKAVQTAGQATARFDPRLAGGLIPALNQLYTVAGNDPRVVNAVNMIHGMFSPDVATSLPHLDEALSILQKSGVHSKALTFFGRLTQALMKQDLNAVNRLREETQNEFLSAMEKKGLSFEDRVRLTDVYVNPQKAIELDPRLKEIYETLKLENVHFDDTLSMVKPELKAWMHGTPTGPKVKTPQGEFTPSAYAKKPNEGEPDVPKGKTVEDVEAQVNQREKNEAFERARKNAPSSPFRINRSDINKATKQDVFNEREATDIISRRLEELRTATTKGISEEQLVRKQMIEERMTSEVAAVQSAIKNKDLVTLKRMLDTATERGVDINAIRSRLSEKEQSGLNLLLRQGNPRDEVKYTGRKWGSVLGGQEKRDAKKLRLFQRDRFDYNPRNEKIQIRNPDDTPQFKGKTLALWKPKAEPIKDFTKYPDEFLGPNRSVFEAGRRKPTVNQQRLTGDELYEQTIFERKASGKIPLDSGVVQRNNENVNKLTPSPEDAGEMAKWVKAISNSEMYSREIENFDKAVTSIADDVAELNGISKTSLLYDELVRQIKSDRSRVSHHINQNILKGDSNTRWSLLNNRRGGAANNLAWGARNAEKGTRPANIFTKNLIEVDRPAKALTVEEFEKGVKDIATDGEQGDAIIEVVKAFAKAKGMPYDEYVKSGYMGVRRVNVDDPTDADAVYMKNMKISDSPYVKAGMKPSSNPKIAGLNAPEFDGIQLGRNLILAVNRSSSVALHEFGHAFRKHLDDDLLEQASKWAGAKWNDTYKFWDWSTDAEEKFAIEFEKYMASGKAPTKEMKTIFEKFKQWLTEVWEGLAKNKFVKQEVRDTFDKMLGKKSTSKVEAPPLGKDLTPGQAPLLASTGAVSPEHFSAANPSVPVSKNQTLGERLAYGKRYTPEEANETQVPLTELVAPTKPPDEMIGKIQAENLLKTLPTNLEVRSPDVVIKPVLEAVEHSAAPMRRTLAVLKEATFKAASGLTPAENRELVVALDDPTGKFREKLSPELRWRYDKIRDILDTAYVMRWGDDKSHYRTGYFTHLYNNGASFDTAGVAQEYRGSRFWNKRTGELLPNTSISEVMDVYLNSVIRDAYLSPTVRSITKQLGLIAKDIPEHTAEYTRRYLDVVMGVSNMPNWLESSITRRIYSGLLGGNFAAAGINYSQLANTVADIGLKHTYNGIRRLQKEGMLEPGRHGAIENTDHMWNDSLKQLASPARRVMAAIDNFVMSPHRKSEMQIRAITYFSALEQAEKELGLKGNEAVDHALFKVNELMFNASKYNTAPALSDNPVGRFMKIFQTYPIRQTQLVGKWLYRAATGDKHAAKALARLGASLSIISFAMNEAGLDYNQMIDWFPLAKIAAGRNPLSNPMTDAAKEMSSLGGIFGTAAKLIPGYILWNRAMKNLPGQDKGVTYADAGLSDALDEAAKWLLQGSDQRKKQPPRPIEEYKSTVDRGLSMLGFRTNRDTAKKRALDAMNSDRVNDAVERRMQRPETVPPLIRQPTGQKPDRVTTRMNQVPKMVRANAREAINQYREVQNDPYFRGTKRLIRSVFGSGM